MSRMSEEARRQREEEVEITIGQVGKARAAEVIAALRVHNRSPEEVGQIIMATGMYLVGVLGITEHRTGSKRADETPR